jgi:peptide/nickel transport system permease protein
MVITASPQAVSAACARLTVREESPPDVADEEPEWIRTVAVVCTGEAAKLKTVTAPGTMQAVFQFYGSYRPEVKDSPVAIRLAVAMAIPLGVISAVYRSSIIDRIGSIIAVLGAAMPSFWLGIGLIHFFSVYLGVLPSAHMGGPEHYILPALTLGRFAVAGLMRLVRSNMLEILDAEFVKLARIKGLSEWLVIWKHCLRNAMIPVLSLFGVLIAVLVTGAIVMETVFAWPGVRRLAYEAVIFRDYPLLQAVIILKAIIVLCVNLAIDILYAYVDPRIRHG